MSRIVGWLRQIVNQGEEENRDRNNIVKRKECLLVTQITCNDNSEAVIM